MDVRSSNRPAVSALGEYEGYSFPEYDGSGRMIFIPKASRKGDIVPLLTAALEKWAETDGTVSREGDK